MLEIKGNQIYEIAENTRDFSHEMNRLRIGRGLCHVNYPTYAQVNIKKSTNIMLLFSLNLLTYVIY